MARGGVWLSCLVRGAQITGRAPQLAPASDLLDDLGDHSVLSCPSRMLSATTWGSLWACDGSQVRIDLFRASTSSVSSRRDASLEKVVAIRVGTTRSGSPSSRGSCRRPGRLCGCEAVQRAIVPNVSPCHQECRVLVSRTGRRMPWRGHTPHLAASLTARKAPIRPPRGEPPAATRTAGLMK